MTPNEYKEKLAALNAEFYGNSSSHVGGGVVNLYLLSFNLYPMWQL